MMDTPDGDVPDAAPHALREERDSGWSLLGAALQRPRAMENTTLTAVLLLFLVAADDREKAMPASGRVINLISELQQLRADTSTGDGLRASIIKRLSDAITVLRRDLD
ncbi:MAG: hypothetical protein HIU92_15150 [Proteobacteria bacterium]|nr:hypothetical protein [Pseudomonadota bacterium]